MSKILVIGSTVCDVMIYVDKLPSRQGDVHISKQMMNLGGCAFNVANLLHRLQIPYTLISPVGSGLYGDFVKQSLAQLGIDTSIRLTGANGCCYCFVEADGERTFLSDHGVEYLFKPEWLANLDMEEYAYTYVCGLEVEESTGDALVDALATLSSQIVFCPGPRGHLIPSKRWQKLYGLKPILHLNEAECLTLAEETNLKQAVYNLFHRTGNLVIVTRGELGVIAYDGKWYDVASYPSQIRDTIGAGDSHIAAVLAALIMQKSLPQALDFANRVASQIIGTNGVHLPETTYQMLREMLH